MADDEHTYNAAVDMIDRHLAEGRGTKTAIIDDKGSYTYEELAHRVNRCANMLQGLGLQREARVAVIMLDTVDFPSLFWGAIKAGIIPLALNTLLTAEQYRDILNDCRARTICISAALLPSLEPILDELEFVEQIIVSGGDAGAHLNFDDMAKDASDTFEAVKTHRDETAFWLYSSGSTGLPKGVMHRHTSPKVTADTYGTHVLGTREDDVLFSRGQTVLRLRPGQRHELSPRRRRNRCADG